MAHLTDAEKDNVLRSPECPDVKRVTEMLTETKEAAVRDLQDLPSEKYNVGTGATRTSTLAEISKAGQDASLLSESKGVLKLTKCGKVSYALQEGCRIADPLVTEELFKTMDAVGKFETNPESVLSQVADMVQHDMQTMQGNDVLVDI